MFFRKSKQKSKETTHKKKKEDVPLLWRDVSLPKLDQQISFSKSIQKGAPTPVSHKGVAMDSGCDNFKLAFNARTSLPNSILDFFATQGFIGYQAAAILSQNALIDKACTMPAQDSVRNGYEITVNSGADISTDIIDDLYEIDKEYHLTNNMIDFGRMGRIFGIRIALFKVESDDPDYYLKPFNIDGIKPGSYKGIVQYDPYWITPELDLEASADPSGIDPITHMPTF